MSDNALKSNSAEAAWKSRAITESGRNSESPPNVGTRNLHEVVARAAEAETTAVQTSDVGSGQSEAKQKEWASTLLLVQEACEAIRVSEERVEALEAELEQAAIQSRDDLKQMLSRLQAAQEEIKAANSRTKAAEARANEAEAWLARLNEAIVDGFGRPSGRWAETEEQEDA